MENRGIDASGNPGKNILSARTVANAIGNFRITLCFYFAYVVVNYLYVVILRSQAYNYLAVFLVSPFNILETLSKVYSSPLEGLQENFVLVVLIIFLAEAYSRQAQIFRKSQLTITRAFILSIAATYITSALWWAIFGVPGNGTSIIAFGLLIYLGVVAVADSRVYGKKTDRKTRSEKAKTALWMAALAISFLFGITYILGNSAFPIHIAGAGIFGALMGLSLRRRGLQRG